MARPDVFESLNALTGMQGDQAQSDFESAPLPYETPGMTQGRVAQGQTQRIQYGRMKAEDLASRGIPYDTNGRGNVSEITDDTGAPLSNADKTNKIAYDSSGKPVDYSQKDPTTGKRVLRDPYQFAPTKTDAAGNIYSAPAGLPWQDTRSVDPVVQQQAQQKVNAQTATALAPVEQQAKAQLAQSAKAVKVSAAQLKTAAVLNGFTGIDPTQAPEQIRQAAQDNFSNAVKNDPEANKTGYFGNSGTLTPEAESKRKVIAAQQAAVLAAINQHQAVFDQARQAQAALDAVRTQRQQFQGDKITELNRRRVAVGLDPVSIPGVTPPAPSVAEQAPVDAPVSGDEQSSAPAPIAAATPNTPAAPQPAVAQATPAPPAAPIQPIAKTPDTVLTPEDAQQVRDLTLRNADLALGPNSLVGLTNRIDEGAIDDKAAALKAQAEAATQQQLAAMPSSDALPVHQPQSESQLPTGDGGNTQKPLKLLDSPEGSGATPEDYPLESLGGLTREKVAAARANDYKPGTAGEAVNTPIAPLKRMGAEEAGTVARSLDKYGILDGLDTHTVDHVSRVLQNVSADTVNFFQTPLGIATLGVGALPKAAQKAISAVFFAQAAHEAPGAAHDFLTAKTPEERDAALTSFVESIAVLGGTGAHILDRARAANASVGDPNAGPVQRIMREPPEEPGATQGLGPSPNEPTPPSQPSPQSPNLALPEPAVPEPVSPAANEPATGSELALRQKELAGMAPNDPMRPLVELQVKQLTNQGIAPDSTEMEARGQEPSAAIRSQTEQPPAVIADQSQVPAPVPSETQPPSVVEGSEGPVGEADKSTAAVGEQSPEPPSSQDQKAAGSSPETTLSRPIDESKPDGARVIDKATLDAKLASGTTDSKTLHEVKDKVENEVKAALNEGKEVKWIEQRSGGEKTHTLSTKGDRIVDENGNTVRGLAPMSGKERFEISAKPVEKAPVKAVEPAKPVATPSTSAEPIPPAERAKDIHEQIYKANQEGRFDDAIRLGKSIDPKSVLHEAKNVKLTTPKGAQFIRVTDSKGRQIVEPIANVTKGANPFHQAGPFKKVEAGVMNSKKQFVPLRGEITATDKQSEVPGRLPQEPTKEGASRNAESAPSQTEEPSSPRPSGERKPSRIRSETTPEAAKDSSPKPVTSPEGQQVQKLANAALALHKDSLTALGHPQSFETGETRAGSGIETDVQSQRIRIDPEKLAAATSKMTPAVRAEFVKRAVAQEVIHVGTLKYAAESAANREKLLGLTEDKELMDRAGKAYGPEWKDQSDFAKAAEAARMLLEGPEKLTEASYKFLKDFLEWMKTKLKNLSKDAREVLDGIRVKLGQYEKSAQETKEQVPPKEESEPQKQATYQSPAKPTPAENPATPAEIRAEIDKLKARGEPVPNWLDKLSKKEPLYAATPDAGATPEGGASEKAPSGSQPDRPEGEGTLTKGGDTVASRNEKLMEEAEAAGLSPSLETIKGLIANKPETIEKVRQMIRDRTGKEAINAAKPELPEKPSEMPLGAANPSTPPGKRKVPGLDILKNVKEGVQSLALPSAIDAEHLEAAEVLGGKLGAMNQRAESARALSAPAWLQFEKEGVHKEQPLATNPGVQFMSNASTGRPQAVEYQHYADLREREYAKRVDALDKADVPLQNVRDNYFPGVWTNESRRAFNLAMGAARESGIIPDGVTVNTATAAQKDWVKQHVEAYLKENRGSDDNSALGYLTRNPFKGKEGFRKQKVFDQDIITAMEFGLKPVSANPVDIDRLKWSEMDRNIMANEAMKEWKIYNQMRVVAPGAKVPDGWEKVDPDGKHGIGNVYAPPNPDVFGRTIVGQRIVPHAVADILNNYLSSTLYNNRYFGKLYTGWMGLANALNQSQLGVGSAFHAGFTTAEKEITAGAEVIKDIYGVLTGNRHFGHLMGSVGGVFKAGWDTAKLISYFGRKGATGNDVLNAWRFPDQTIDPKIAQVVRAAELAGGGFTMERGLQTDQTSKMVSDWYNGKALKAAARSPVAAIEMMAHPIMNYLVPRQKAGAFAMLANRIIDENPGVPLEELRPEFRQAWNRIDARMGQVRYDRLFANNVAKNVVQGVVRAPGWSGGTIAELGGAFKDTYSFFKEWAQNGKAPKNIPDRVAYTIALVAGTMIVNGILTKLMTGQNPEGLDYFAFRDGGKDEKGNPSRLILPTYMKDLLAYTKEPLGTLADKQHPILALIHDLVQNKDYYGVKIRNEDDGKLKQAYDSGKYFAKAFVPFWVRGEQKMAEQGKTPLQKALPMIGVMPAAQKVTNTPAQKLASEYARDSMPVGGRTQAQADKSDAERKIVQQLRAGKSNDIPQAIRAGTIKATDVPGLIKRAGETPLHASVQHLALDKAEAVFKVANPQEKKELLPMMLTKRENATKKTVQFSTTKGTPYNFH